MEKMAEKFRADHQNQRMDESANMESTAAEFTSDIPSFVQGRNINIMLGLYKTRLLTAAAGQLPAA
jgi:hypothetical protein